jgi:O-antigen/teichoic acid export membrane protein
MPDGATETTGASVLRGGVWTVSSHLLPALYTLALSVTAARFLGPAGMGEQSFIAFIEISLTLLFTAGLPVALNRYVGELVGQGAPQAIRGLLWWAWRLEAIGAVLGGATMGMVALTRSSLQGAWALGGVACLMAIMHTIPSAVLLGLQRFRQASMVGLVGGAVGTAAAVAVLAGGGGITGMFAVEAAVSAGTLAWTGALASRALPIVPVAEAVAGLQAKVARYAAVASIQVVVALVVWRRSEFLFLRRYSGPEEIALYSIAFAAITALTLVPLGIASVISPSVATLFGAGATERIRSGFGRALRLLTVVSLALTAMSAALGPPLLRVVYGEAYKGAGPILFVLTLAFPIIPLYYLSSALLQGIGRQKATLAANVVASVVNIGCDILLVPRHQALGAAWANVVAQVVAGSFVLAAACRSVAPVRFEVRVVLRAFVASGVGGLSGWAVVSFLPGLPGIVLGLLAAVIALVSVGMVLGILTSDDVEWLSDAIGGGVGRTVGSACRLFVRRSRSAAIPARETTFGEH